MHTSAHAERLWRRAAQVHIGAPPTRAQESRRICGVAPGAEAVPGGFGYYTPPAASAVSPAVGPAAGSTSLVVTGYAIGAAYGTQLECMLGGLVVEATRLTTAPSDAPRPTPR